MAGSESFLEGRRLVSNESSTLERIAGSTAGAAVLLVLVGWVALFEFVDVRASLAGVSVATAIGALLALVGVALVAVGVGSRLGLLAATPDATGNPAAGLFYAGIGFVVGGLVGAQTLGLSTLWPAVALGAGLLLGAAATFLPEDLATTLPAGALTALAGGVVLTGVIGPSWRWNPAGFSATFQGTVAIPVFAIVVGLLAAWTAAQAYEGFGTRGRQSGAYLLVTANAVGMAALLFLLVAFIFVRGFAPMTRGIRLGLFFEPVFWFYFPPIQEYVVLNAPGLWFYWPFVMEGATLTNEINGVLPAIVGTVWLVVGAVAFAVPLGVGAAVFLTEYAERGRFTQLVEVSTNGLWSTPSIVYGLFGLAFLVPRLGNTTSLLAGQLVLGFMLLPLVVITSREALKSVPGEYRDASAALGVSRWETIKSVVLPAAMPGVVTGVILGVGRIAGETAPILLVTVGAPFPGEPIDVLGSFQLSATPPFVTNPALVQPTSALPYQLYAIITAGVESGEIDAWATALVLLIVVLGFYAVGIGTRIYFRRKLNR